MSRGSIGEFEQLVLLAILRLGLEAYGVAIMDEIEATTGRKVRRSAVYMALRRLEDKGLVSFRLGESRAERGGRARKYFSVKAEGKALLRDSMEALRSMWRGVEPKVYEA